MPQVVARRADIEERRRDRPDANAAGLRADHLAIQARDRLGRLAVRRAARRRTCSPLARRRNARCGRVPLGHESEQRSRRVPPHAVVAIRVPVRNHGHRHVGAARRCASIIGARSKSQSVSPLTIRNGSVDRSGSARRGPPADPSTGCSHEYRAERPRCVPSPTIAVMLSGRWCRLSTTSRTPCRCSQASHVLDQRPIAERDGRLGDQTREGIEARAETGGEDEGGSMASVQSVNRCDRAIGIGNQVNRRFRRSCCRRTSCLEGRPWARTSRATTPGTTPVGSRPASVRAV